MRLRRWCVLALCCLALPACTPASEEEPSPPPGDDDSPTLTPTPSATPVGDDDDFPTPPDFETPVPVEFNPGAWESTNFSTLKAFIDEHSGESTDGQLPVAVLEWNDTSLFGNAGATVWRYQVENLRLEVSPDDLELIVPPAAGLDFDSTWDVTHLGKEFGGVSLEALATDIVAAFTELYPKAATLGCDPEVSSCKSLEELAGTEAYQDFVAKLMLYYEGLNADPMVGPGFTTPFITRFFAGFRESDAQAVVVDAWLAAEKTPVGPRTVESPDRGEAGKVDVTFMEGLKTIEEMRNLYAYLRAMKYEVWLVTTAPTISVAGMAGVQSGYDVAENRVLGYELTKNAGRYSIELLAQPVPYGVGKVDLINQYVRKQPAIVVGSRSGDERMLTTWSLGALGLIINVNEGCPFVELTASVLDGSASGLYLVQGLDLNDGTFRAAQTSIPYGANEALELSSVSCEK